MFEKLKTMIYIATFMLSLVIYLGYLTWWAASLNQQVVHNSKNISDNHILIVSHITADATDTRNLDVVISEVRNLQQETKEIQKLQKENIAVHAKCGAILDGVLRRMEKLEDKR